MAQDYHIYIHGDGNGSSGNQTQPFAARALADGGKGVAFATKAQKAYSVGSSVASGSAIGSGAASLVKAVPVLTIAYIIWKVIDKTLATGFAHQEEYYGAYKNSVGFNNFKTHSGNILNPIKFGFNVLHQNKQIEKHNLEVAQQNKLIGNSILKDFNIGV